MGTCGTGQICCASTIPGNSATTTCASLGGTCVDGSVGCDASSSLEPNNDECDTNGEVCCKSAAAAAPSGPTAGATGQCGVSGNTISFCNPLKYNTVEDVLYSLLNALQGIIVVLSIIFIVIGAILYITSAGNEERTKMAKKAITASMVGLAIGIAAPTFLKEIALILNWTPTNDKGMVTGALTLAQIAIKVLNFLLSIVGALAIIMMVVGGVMYLGSAGNEESIKTAKKLVLYSIIGIAIALAALVITKQIANFFIA
jgi:hypothetical protein